MVGAVGRGRTESRERGGAPLVRPQAPAAGRRVVDRPPDERVPEAKPAGHVRLANEVEPQEFVKCLERSAFGDG